MSLPKVSVVIPCFNLGGFLPDAIASVRRQTYSSIEIIVVNDGSTELETLKILEQYANEGVRIYHTENSGVVAARNLGIKHAVGDYILALDADDKISPDYLSKAVEQLENDPDVGIVYGLVEFFGERSGLWQQADYSVPRLLIENMIVVSAVYRRTDWEKVKGYSEAMQRGWEDWDLWLSIVETGKKVVKLPEVVFYYRIRKDSRERSLTYTQKLRLLIRLMRNHPKLYLGNIGPFLLGMCTFFKSRW